MKRMVVLLALGAGFLVGATRFAPQGLVAGTAGLSAQKTEAAQTTALTAFSAIDPIDTHTHAFHSDAEFYDMMDRLHLHVLDICVADSHNLFRSLAPELASARKFIQASNGHAALCTTFDPFAFDKPGFAERAIQQLNADFARDAVAVKIWKNIGMELKWPNGAYVMPDDPVFEPIYKDIAAHHKTLIAHLAEPSSCWQPPNPESPDYDYYKEHPEWYMYLHPDHPSKQKILAARDRLLAQNPHLRVVGAHFGSMETDVDLIARHLDQYPNFAVDMAARMEYLMIQPRQKVRQFLIKYQDRVLYATDLEFLVNESPNDAIKEWQDTYARDWQFLATDSAIPYHGRRIEGLQLPPAVLKKIFHDNAIHWIPGILAKRD